MHCPLSDKTIACNPALNVIFAPSNSQFPCECAPWNALHAKTNAHRVPRNGNKKGPQGSSPQETQLASSQEDFPFSWEKDGMSTLFAVAYFWSKVCQGQCALPQKRRSLNHLQSLLSALLGKNHALLALSVSIKEQEKLCPSESSARYEGCD